MAFVAPKWDSENNHYVIDLSSELMDTCRVKIGRDAEGNTGFVDTDEVLNYTDKLLHLLISEGDKYKWFAKLPSHEQLMKRVKHSFKNLASQDNNGAMLSTLLLTPKVVTLVWTPITVTEASAPPLYFDDSGSESESSAGTEPELEDSRLPPVALVDGAKESREEYLLTRLRAAKARVEAEQIRMQYFETTGRMPPDSDSETDED